MQPEAGDRIRSAERPAGKDRVHDLEAMRDPVDATEKFAVAHVRLRGLHDMEGDLRLDERLAETGQGEGCAGRSDGPHRTVEHMAPHRPRNPILSLDLWICKPHLATDWGFAARAAEIANAGGDAVGLPEIEFRIAGAIGRDLPSRAE